MSIRIRICEVLRSLLLRLTEAHSVDVGILT